MNIEYFKQILANSNDATSVHISMIENVQQSMLLEVKTLRLARAQIADCMQQAKTDAPQFPGAAYDIVAGIQELRYLDNDLEALMDTKKLQAERLKQLLAQLKDNAQPSAAKPHRLLDPTDAFGK